MAKEPAVLDLKLDARPKVRIDGKLYELRTRSEFLFNVHQHSARGTLARLGALMTKRKRSVADDKAFSRLLDQVTRELLLAPPAVQKLLSDVHRVQLLQAFMNTAPAKGRA